MKCLTCCWFVYLSQTFLQNYEVKISTLVHLKSWGNLLQVISVSLYRGQTL